MSNLVKRESPILFSFVDNSIRDTAETYVSFNKAGIPITAESGLVNVIQEIDDVTVMTSEFGKTKSKFIDYGLYTAKEITRSGSTVLAARLASGSEAYKTTEVFYDVKNKTIAFGVPKFKNVTPTSEYIKGEDVFSDEKEDYRFEVFEGVNKDIINPYIAEVKAVAAKPAEGNKPAVAEVKYQAAIEVGEIYNYKYLFTFQTFKPTNFLNFALNVRPLTYSEAELISSKYGLGLSVVKTKFIKVNILNVNGAKMEEYVCTIDDEISEDFDNTYCINDVINMSSNYIFIIGKRNFMGNIGFDNFTESFLSMDNEVEMIGNYVVNIDEGGVTSIDTSAGEEKSKLVEVISDNEMSDFRGTYEDTYIASKYESEHVGTTVTTSVRGNIKLVDNATTPKEIKAKLVNYKNKSYIQLGNNLMERTADNVTTVSPIAAGDFTLFINADPNFVPAGHSVTDGIITIKNAGITLFTFSGVHMDHCTSEADEKLTIKVVADDNGDDIVTGVYANGVDGANVINMLVSDMEKLPHEFTVEFESHNYKLYRVADGCYIEEIVKPADVGTNGVHTLNVDDKITIGSSIINNVYSDTISFSIKSTDIVLDINDSVNNIKDVTDNISVTYKSNINDIKFKPKDIEDKADGYKGINKFIALDTYIDMSGSFSISSNLLTVSLNGDKNLIFVNNRTFDVETVYHQGVIDTSTMVYQDDLVIRLNGLFVADEFGIFSLDNVYIDSIDATKNTAEKSIKPFVFKQYNRPDKDAVVSAYDEEKLVKLLDGTHGGSSDASVYEIFFGSKHVLMNTLVDMVAVKESLNADLQSSLVSVVKKRQNICAALSSKNYTKTTEDRVIREWETKGTIDAGGEMVYNYFNEMAVEVLGPWKKDKLDDRSTKYVPTVGYWVGDRLTELAKSPVLNIWGVVTGKEINFTPAVRTEEENFGFYKTLRLNTPALIRNFGTYLWGDFVTYRKESKLNKVKNFQILVYLMNNYYPVLMSYIKKPILTIGDSASNIQNIINDLYRITKNVSAGLASVPVIRLVSTIDDLRSGLIKLTVSLTFADTIEAIDVSFVVEETGEMVYEIVG